MTPSLRLLAAPGLLLVTTCVLLPAVAAPADPVAGNGFGPTQVEDMLAQMHAPPAAQAHTATETTLLSFSDSKTIYQTPAAAPAGYTTVADQWWDLQIALSNNAAAANGGAETSSGQAGRLERLERVELIVDTAMDNMVAQLPSNKSTANQANSSSSNTESESAATTNIGNTGNTTSTGGDSGFTIVALDNAPSSIQTVATVSNDGFVSQGDLDLVLLNWGDGVAPAGFDGETLSGGSGPFDGQLSQNELDGVLLNWGSGNSTECNTDDPLSNVTNCITTVGTPQCATGAGHSGAMDNTACPNP